MICIKPKILTADIKNRTMRLSNPSPSLRRNVNVTLESAETLIRPLYSTTVNESSFDYCLGILEQVYPKSNSCGDNIARCIASNITMGLDSSALSSINLEKYNIPESGKDIITEGLYKTAVCQRILYNQEKLCKRFDLDKIVKERMYNPKRCISELCTLIDTYDIPDNYKLNIALENITYSMIKNGIILEDADFLDSILEYFLDRDMCIPDDVYSKYQTVLTESPIFRSIISESKLASRVCENTSDYFLSMEKKAFGDSDDSYLRDILEEEALNITTEADASEYIENAVAYLESSSLTSDDERRVFFTIQNIPRYTGVSQDFVDIKTKECMDGDTYSKMLSADCILPDKECISEKDKFSDIFDKSAFMDVFSEADGVANTEDIKGLIDKYKAEQDKSPNKIKGFFIKLHTKSPESIIDDLPDIMGFARVCILMAVATVTPIGPIIAGVLGLVSWLLSRKINDKEATRLLNTIRSEKKKIQAKIDKTSNDKKKKQLEDYLSNLKTCEKKVEDYLDKLSDEDHSDPDDDIDDDLDIDFESGIIEVANILTMANDILEFDASSIQLFDNIKECARLNILNDITDLVKESSISIKDYKNLLMEAYNTSIDPIVRTSIMSSIDSLNEKTELSPCRSIAAASIANKALYEASYQIVQEKFNLSTVKLAMQNAKAKLKDLSTKEKSMWQSVDAQGSGLIKSIEKALSSDRREAIIKGNIIPSFSKCIKGAIALAGVGILFGPMSALITAVGGLAVSSALNTKEKKLLYDEINTELKVVEKQIEIAQNDGDMNQYRFLLNYQKKLTREAQRIKYGLKVRGRDIPAATLPGRGGN